MKEIGFGIVGCGVIAPTHAKALQQIEGAKLVAACDIVPEKAEAFAKEYGCDAYTDLTEMLKREDLDAVCVTTPSGLHAEIGIQVAKAGKHVMVEKPIDVTLEKADALIRAAREAGVKLGVISQHRFDDAMIKLKKAVDEGKLGQLNFGGSHTKWYRSQEYYDSGDWRGTWELDGGGAIMNQSVHYVDLLQYIMGPVEEIFAYCATRDHVRIEVEDIAVATVKFRSGALGIIEGNTAAYPGFYTRLDIYGSDGSVIIQADQIVEWKLRGEENADTGAAKEAEGAASAQIGHSSHQRQLEDFVAAIREDREPLVNGEEGRKPLEIIIALYESARTGKPVKLGGK